MGLSFLYLTVILTLGALLPFFKPPAFQDSTDLAGLFAWSGRDCEPTYPLAMDDRRSLRGDCSSWRFGGRGPSKSILRRWKPTMKTTRPFRTCVCWKIASPDLLPLEISLKADKPDLFYKPGHLSQGRRTAAFRDAAKAGALLAVLSRLLQRD